MLGLIKPFTVWLAFGAGFILSAIAATPILAASDSGPSRLCRQAAAWPDATNRGPPFDAINSKFAVRICRAAIEEDAKDWPLYAYLARALVKDNRPNEAFELIFPLRGRNVPEIDGYLGAMFEFGSGVPSDLGKAALLYESAAAHNHAGAQHNLGLLSLRTANDTGARLKARAWLRKAAEQNYVEAQVSLGEALRDATDSGQSKAEAVQWFRRAAIQGNAQAQSDLARALQNAEGVVRDKNTAFALYSEAARKNDIAAQKALGDIYASGGVVEKNAQTAMYWRLRAALQDDAEAQIRVGYEYEHFSDIPQRNEIAAYWYRKAAELGVPEAQANLGILLKAGRGVKQDFRKAASWFRMAAVQNYATAQAQLGYLYESGQGVKQNAKIALYWYELAVDSGDPNALWVLGSVYSDGKIVKKDEYEAVRLWRLAAAKQNSNALNSLGQAYRHGLGVFQDNKVALDYFLKASELGNLAAYYNLGMSYLEGRDPRKGDAEAFKLFSKSAEAGDPDSQVALGWLYSEGRGVRPNIGQAMYWYRRSLELKSQSAAAEISSLYRSGKLRGSPEDEYVWAKKAAEADDADGMYQLASLLEIGRIATQDMKSALHWHLKAAEAGEEESLNRLLTAATVPGDPLHDALVHDEAGTRRLGALSARVGEFYEDTELSCYAMLHDCGAYNWRRVDIQKAARWYRLGVSYDPEAGFRLGRLLETHPELEVSVGEAKASLSAASLAGNENAKYLQLTLTLRELTPSQRDSEVGGVLSSFGKSTAAKLAFEGVIGRFGDFAIGPSFAYLEQNSKVADNAIALISVYSFFGAYDEAQKIALTLHDAQWFEISGWDYSINHLIDFWHQSFLRGYSPDLRSASGLKSLLATLDGLGSPSASLLLRKLEELRNEIDLQHTSSGVQASTITPSAAEADLYRTTARIEEKEGYSGLPPILVLLYQRLAKDQLALGHNAQAERSILTALSISERINADTRHIRGGIVFHLERSCQYANASEALFEIGNKENALLLAKSAVNELQDARAMVASLPQKLQLCFKNVVGDQYRYLAEILIKQEHFVEAEWVLEQLKDYEAFQFANNDVALKRKSFDHFPLTDGEMAITSAIIGLPLADKYRLTQRQNELLSLDSPTPQQESELKEVRAQLYDASTKLGASLNALQAATKSLESPAREERSSIPTEDWFVTRADRLSGLKSSTALVYSVILPERIHVLITTSQGTEHVEIAIHETIVNALTERLRSDLQDTSKDPTFQSRQFYDTVWNPVDKVLAQLGVTDVVLSLDGRLRYVPFGAVYDGKQYLLEKYHFTLLTPSSTDQIGDTETLNVSSIQALGVTHGGYGFKPLPNVAPEILALVRTVDNPAGLITGKAWLDEAFSRRGFSRALTLGSPVVHVATHFAIGSSLSTSRLLLGDGLLSVADLTAGVRAGEFDFKRTRLIVFSACETAMGGGQEVESLAASLDAVGLRSIVATLWPINDSSTSEFVVLFYNKLRDGVPRAEALRQAQLYFLRSETSSVKYRHPRYWAPFILLGQWK